MNLTTTFPDSSSILRSMIDREAKAVWVEIQDADPNKSFGISKKEFEVLDNANSPELRVDVIQRLAMETIDSLQKKIPNRDIRGKSRDPEKFSEPRDSFDALVYDKKVLVKLKEEILSNKYKQMIRHFDLKEGSGLKNGVEIDKTFLSNIFLERKLYSAHTWCCKWKKAIDEKHTFATVLECLEKMLETSLTNSPSIPAIFKDSSHEEVREPISKRSKKGEEHSFSFKEIGTEDFIQGNVLGGEQVSLNSPDVPYVTNAPFQSSELAGSSIDSNQSNLSVAERQLTNNVIENHFPKSEPISEASPSKCEENPSKEGIDPVFWTSLSEDVRAEQIALLILSRDILALKDLEKIEKNPSFLSNIGKALSDFDGANKRPRINENPSAANPPPQTLTSFDKANSGYVGDSSNQSFIPLLLEQDRTDLDLQLILEIDGQREDFIKVLRTNNAERVKKWLNGKTAVNGLTINSACLDFPYAIPTVLEFVADMEWQFDILKEAVKENKLLAIGVIVSGQFLADLLQAREPEDIKEALKELGKAVKKNPVIEREHLDAMEKIKTAMKKLKEAQKN